MGYTTCRACRGTRLRPEAQHVLVGGRPIGELAGMTPAAVLEALDGAGLTESETRIARDLLVEIRSRLGFMIDVGLGYLTLSRLTKTLSGGEAQRINLAGSLGASLVDTLYVLDEPSVGLHAADTERLVAVVRRLRDIGNTVLIVEHDPDIIRSADHLLDLGPGPGSAGGRVLFNGTVEEASAADVPESATLSWVFGRHGEISLRGGGRKPSGRVELRGVSQHNLKSVDVDIPLGQLVCVTGVSGSGKSTLVVDVLGEVLGGSRSAEQPPEVGSVRVEGRIDKVLLVDQSPIGASPRSNPVTYIKGFAFIREVFARQRASLVRGYQAGRFSFNKPGGRCPRCEGMGYRRVEMHFMADVFVPCEECGGRRYNRETLEIEYRGRTIADVLEMTVDEAIMFFDEVPQLGEKLWVMAKTGLGYLRLGQPSNTLSGGEAQRIKIARELAESG
ncbi:MAG: excinuclease ABC subunit UvrA, partial [Candidatus Krumholzibacteria bacterium]|nr:excinuclease ABC subunit UvrA [Candidatus Krumholzibacteria bacterium]